MNNAVGVLLAGGRSARAGALKGLFVRHGEAWLTAQARALGARCRGGVVVVLGHRHTEYLDALPWLRESRTGSSRSVDIDARCEINPAPDRGPFSSLQVGLAALAGHARAAVFVLPIDVPCADEAVFAALRTALVAPVEACVPVVGERGGHPVLLSPQFSSRLQEVDPGSADARLDVQLRALDGGRIARVRVADEKVLLNLNTPADWDAFGA